MNIEQMTEALQALIMAAVQMAADEGNSEITPEHILYRREYIDTAVCGSGQ